MGDENKDDHDEIIRLGVVVETQGKELAEVRRNIKAGIFAILALVTKSMFDYFSKGAP